MADAGYTSLSAFLLFPASGLCIAYVFKWQGVCFYTLVLS